MDSNSTSVKRRQSGRKVKSTKLKEEMDSFLSEEENDVQEALDQEMEMEDDPLSAATIARLKKESESSVQKSEMDQFNEELIILIHSFPCLYNHCDGNFTDFVFKETVWKEIGKELNVSPKYCRVRWKSLRDRYRREKNAVLSDPTGNELKKLKSWKCAASLNFLDSVMEPANKMSNKSFKDSYFEECTTDKEETSCSSSIPTLNSSQKRKKNKHIDDSSTSNNQTPSNTRKRKNDNLFKDVLMTIKKKYEEAAPPSNKYSNFIQLLCEKLDKLQPDKVDDVEMDILLLVNNKIKESI